MEVNTFKGKLSHGGKSLVVTRNIGTYLIYLTIYNRRTIS